MKSTNDKVVNFLQGLNIPTVKRGGFEQQAVFDALKQLSTLYEEEMDAMAARQNSAVAAAQASLDSDKERLETELAKQAEQTRLLQNRVKALEAELENYKTMLPKTQATSEAYTSKMEELTQAIAYIKQQKSSILADAESLYARELEKTRQETDRIRKAAYTETETICLQEINKAKAEAEKIRQDAAIEKERLEEEIKELANKRQQMVLQFRQMYRQFSDVIDTSGGGFSAPPEATMTDSTEM